MGAAGVLGVLSFFWGALFGSADLEALGSFFDLGGFDVCFGRSGSTVSVSMAAMNGCFRRLGMLCMKRETRES